jgi:hypothetical protein
MKKALVYIISNIYSKLIILNLFLLNLSKEKKYFYNHSIGFGDSLDYYLDNYYKILNKSNNLPLSFGSFNHETIKFLFKNYKKILFSIPSFLPFYSIMNEVKKSKQFKPIISYDLLSFNLMQNEYLGLRNKETKKIFLNKLKKYKIKDKIKKLSKKKYVCLFIKHYNNNVNDISNGSVIRQTTNFQKIIKIIKYLDKKKIHTVILGDKHDKGTIILKNLIKEPTFLLDLKVSFADQIYIASKSIGYIGSSGGTYIPYFYLKKKILTFDTWIIPTCKTSVKYKNLLNLYKKIYINKKFKTLSYKNWKLKNKKNSFIKENSFLEIRPAINNFLLK